MWGAEVCFGDWSEIMASGPMLEPEQRKHRLWKEMYAWITGAAYGIAMFVLSIVITAPHFFGGSGQRSKAMPPYCWS